MSARFEHVDPLTSTTIHATTYPYGRSVDEHGWQIQLEKEGDLADLTYRVIRLPVEQALRLAVVILGSYRAPGRATRLLGPSEVGAMFGVNTKTVTRWAVEGKLAAIRTPGGHRRYAIAAVLELLGDGS